MANINSFPNNQDVYIGAETVMRWLHGRTSGVFGGDGNLAVEAVSGSYAVTVRDGTGWMSNDNADGVVIWIDNEDRTQNKLQLQPTIANATLPRIDRVVISWETTDYTGLPTVTILAGTPASSPIPPALTNNNLMRQISLARIRIPAGATQITSDMITDERLDKSVCGIVTGTVEFDTTVMQAQFETLLAAIEQELGRLNAGTEAMMKTEYDPNGEGAAVTIQTYAHSKDGTVHNFVGHGPNGRALMTADVESGDTFALNGATVDAYMGAESASDSMAGNAWNGKWVSFIAEDGQLNFKGGGGLSGSKLAAASAALADVLAGKTFYSGDKAIKTGTMPNNGAWGYTLDPNGTVGIPSGYHNGGGTVHARTPSGEVTLSAGQNHNNWASGLPTSKGRASADIHVAVSGNSVRVYGSIEGWIEGNNGKRYGSGSSTFDQTFYVNYV